MSWFENRANYIWLTLFAWLATGQVVAAMPVLEDPLRGDGAVAASPTFVDDQYLSLEELKATAAKRSRLKDVKATSEIDQFAPPEPRLKEFEEHIGPILHRSCVDCHGPDSQEGNVRIDTLNPNLQLGKDAHWWTEVYAAISKGEMPPPESNELNDLDRAKVIQWLSGELQAASIARRQAGTQSAFRRLTQYEYNYALQDLLGLPWEFAGDLPPEAHSEDGFQNSSQLLHMSPMQLDTYLRLARRALNRATVRGDKPAVLSWGIPMQEASKVEWPKQTAAIEKLNQEQKENPEKLQEELAKLVATFKQTHHRAYFRDLTSGNTALATWEYYGARYAIAPVDTLSGLFESVSHHAILPGGHRAWFNLELGNQLPDEGTLRVRVRAWRLSEDMPEPSMQLYFGWQASNEGRALLRVSQQDTVIDAPSQQPHFYQWDIPLGEIYPRNNVRKLSPMGAMPSPSEYIRLHNSSATASDIGIDYVEVMAPVYDVWPPESHQRIFHDSPNRSDEAVYAGEVLSRFMNRAWRRPVSRPELESKLKLFASIRPDCESLEEAMLEVLATVLSSPQFLYLSQGSDKNEAPSVGADLPSQHPTNTMLDGYELATRLSIFLWCSIPDDQLLQAASEGLLNSADGIAAQVRRMLADPRSQRFADQFVHQWLDMQLLDYLNIAQSVPGFDPLLKEAMQREPSAMFEEMLRQNESVLNFIHADYAMVNERLAAHYGIEQVYGNHFRRVPLDGSFYRGGLLTQAGLLMMNSDYPDSHPLKRGVWLLESILNDPPPPPPPAVPQIDLANPEIAKMTLKERIEDHRNQAACKSCHAKIDPWGIAFENYDALGRWRDESNGKPVDASSELFNHQTLNGMNGLKRFLLSQRQDQFVLSVTHKMSTFALGRQLKFEDRSQVESIAAKVRQQGDGLGALVEAVATSELFRSR